MIACVVLCFLQNDKKNGWINVGENLQGAVHFKIGELFLPLLCSLVGVTPNAECFLAFSVKYDRIKFLVIALRDSVEIYAWAPKPYSKFMAFKVKT